MCYFGGMVFFGERLRAITVNYASNLDYIKHDISEPINPDRFEEYLKTNEVDVVIMTHVETSTRSYKSCKGNWKDS